ncbi:disulfide oxidoreductase [NY_014 poxvirus]|uniref:disulfide oxidoreductase n=1 Tax=NY_014 poxvirus TaxID=2025360 RepID=UPI000B9A116D|nr:disulfide oxidoreductase [NY_014 poxvirus]AST09474.1 disulfide oxidoreductase [NY_014 poxvirus]
MKNVLIIFGKSYCGFCENVSEEMEELKTEYDILRIDILSFFLKEGESNLLGDETRGTLIGNFTGYLSDYIVTIFKYNPETKQMAFVDINKAFITDTSSKKILNMDVLKSEIEKATYGAWPPKKE